MSQCYVGRRGKCIQWLNFEDIFFANNGSDVLGQNASANGGTWNTKSGF